jgi:hypothetical protein
VGVLLADVLSGQRRDWRTRILVESRGMKKVVLFSDSCVFVTVVEDQPVEKNEEPGVTPAQ